MKQISKMPDENNNDRRSPSELGVRRIFESEIGRYAAIFMFFIPLMVFGWSIEKNMQATQLDIALIKQNHLAHIETIEKELTEQKEALIQLQKDDNETQKEILVILEKLSK